MTEYLHAGQYGPEIFMDEDENLLKSKEVNVFLPGTATLADLYTNRLKAAPAANPFMTDTRGNGTFFANPGVYELEYADIRYAIVVPLDPEDMAATPQFDMSIFADVVEHYGCIESNNPADAAYNNPRVQAALDENAFVVCSGGVMVDEVVAWRDFSEFWVLPQGGLFGSGAATVMFELQGDYAKAGGVFVPSSGRAAGDPGALQLAGIKATGYRNFLDNATVTGISQNAVVAANLELQCWMGRYRGGIAAALRYHAADGNVADMTVIGTYLQHSGNGLDADGAGSIDMVGVHSESNVGVGFKMNGTSASRASQCFADSNGGDGWNISNSNYGLDFIMCHSFRNSSLADGRYDWSFQEVFNATLTACDSQGNPRNNTNPQTQGGYGFKKGGSWRFVGDNDITLDKCKVGDVTHGVDPLAPNPADPDPHGTAAVIGYTSQIRVHNGSGLLLPYNTAPGQTKSSTGTTLAAAATAAITERLKTAATSTANSVRSFLVTATWRRTANTGYDTDVFIVHYTVGLSGGTPVKELVPATGVTIANVTMVSENDNSSVPSTAHMKLTFDVTNIAGLSIQVGFSVIELASNRGLAF